VRRNSVLADDDEDGDADAPLNQRGLSLLYNPFSCSELSCLSTSPSIRTSLSLLSLLLLCLVLLLSRRFSPFEH
jgi:hypothetical protein